MVNLHHGRVADYRGGPAGFWEIYNDDPRAAMERAYTVDAGLMGAVVAAIAAGTSMPIAVDFADGTVRTLPSRAQVRELQRRLGRPVRHDDFARLPVLPER